jgi:hypothetical protein
MIRSSRHFYAIQNDQLHKFSTVKERDQWVALQQGTASHFRISTLENKKISPPPIDHTQRIIEGAL